MNITSNIIRKAKDIGVVLCSLLIWYLLHSNDYNIFATLENNFYLILIINIFGLYFFYSKYLKKNKR